MVRDTDTDERNVNRKTVLDGLPERTGSTSDDRRRFLKGALATVTGTLASAVGLSNRVRAANPPNAEIAKAAAREYASTEAVRELVSANAGGLLETLADEGHLQSAGPDALSLETIHPDIRSYVDADEGVLVAASAPDGEPSVKVQIKQSLPGDRLLVVLVDPDDGTSNARIEKPNADRLPEQVQYGSDDDVTIQCHGCGERTFCGQTCGPYSCGCAEYHEVYFTSTCANPVCTKCEIISYDCCGTDSC